MVLMTSDVRVCGAVLIAAVPIAVALPIAAALRLAVTRGALSYSTWILSKPVNQGVSLPTWAGL